MLPQRDSRYNSSLNSTTLSGAEKNGAKTTGLLEPAEIQHRGRGTGHQLIIYSKQENTNQNAARFFLPKKVLANTNTFLFHYFV